MLHCSTTACRRGGVRVPFVSLPSRASFLSRGLLGGCIALINRSVNGLICCTRCASSPLLDTHLHHHREVFVDSIKRFVLFIEVVKCFGVVGVRRLYLTLSEVVLVKG